MIFELSHDSLASRVFAKVSSEEKARRKVERFIKERYAYYLAQGVLLTQKDLEYIGVYLDQVALSPEEHQFIRKSRFAIWRRWLIGIITVVGVIVILASIAVVAEVQRRKAVASEKRAKENEKLAARERADAIAQRELALQERARADKEAEKAASEAKRAEEEATRAEDEAQRAEEEAKRAEEEAKRAAEEAEKAQQNAEKAEAARKKADELREQAETARKKADDLRIQAEDAKKLAEEEEQKNRRLHMLSLAQSLAVKSLQIEDTATRALLAKQAYIFNEAYSGNPYDPSIYGGLYEALSGKEKEMFQEARGHSGSVRSIAVSKDGSHFYTTGSDGRLLKWDVLSEEDAIPYQEVSARSVVQRVLSISTDDRWLISTSSSPIVRIFDLDNPESDAIELKPHAKAPIWDVAFLKDNQHFISAGSDNTLQYCNFGTCDTLAFVSSDVMSLALSPDEFEVAGGTRHGHVKTWDIETGEEIELFHKSQSQILSIEYSHDGRFLAAGDREGVLYIWDRNKGGAEDLYGHKARISDIAFSRDNRLMATASYDGTVRVWSLYDNQNIAGRGKSPLILRDEHDWVMSVAFSEDGEWVIVGYKDGITKRWPTDVSVMADKICGQLKRNLTEREWLKYIGADPPYAPTCE